MGKNEGPILCALPPTQGGSIGHQGEVPNGFHAVHRGAVLEGTGLHLNGLRDFMAWIKQGNYYHGFVAQQGHLHRCPHLAKAPLPKWPQVTPSESHWDSQKRAETPATSSSEPSTRATATPVVEAPVAETPVVETSVTRSNTPAPMETGRVGDSQSLAERVEAGIESEFQQDRPTKHHRSQSRR